MIQGDEEEGTYGHAGMLGAAAAVWEDLCKNHLLAALLDLPADEDCKPAMQHHDHDDGEYDPRMSRSERDRHMEWEGGAAQNYDEGSAHGQARQAADAAKDHQHSSRNKHRPFGEPFRLHEVMQRNLGLYGIFVGICWHRLDIFLVTPQQKCHAAADDLCKKACMHMYKDMLPAAGSWHHRQALLKHGGCSFCQNRSSTRTVGVVYIPDLW